VLILILILAKLKVLFPKNLFLLNKTLNNKLIAFILIAILAVLIYSNSFFAPFTLDDFSSIVNNYAIENPLDFPAIWKFYSNRFILYFTISLNYFFNGTAVFGYHVVNISIHILNGMLVYLILNYILGLEEFSGKMTHQYRNIISLLSSFIFICHPVQVNAVTYIIQRTASLAAMFYLLSILLYIKFRLQKKIRYFILVMLFTVMAMFTKENTITIPFMLILIEFMFFLKDGSFTWKKRIPVIFVLLLTVPIIPCTNLLLKGYSQSDPDVTFKASTSMSRLHYFYTQMNVILDYIRKIFIPYNLNFDYGNDYPISKTIWENNSYISFIILFCIGITALMMVKRNKLLSLGILWFFIGLSVESSFISIKDVYFEHRLYFPLAGFVIFLAGLTLIPVKDSITEKRYTKTLCIIFCFMIVCYSGVTIYRNYIFSDITRLWSDVIKKAPKNDRAYSILATEYLNLFEEYLEEKSKNPGYADQERESYLDYAEKGFLKAIELNDSNSTAHCNLSKVYLLKGEYEKSISEAQESNRISRSKYAYNNLGNAYLKLGKTEEAINAFLKGYELDNRCTFILKALGNVYYDINNYEKAEYYYSEFLKYNKYAPENEEVEARLEIIKSNKKE